MDGAIRSAILQKPRSDFVKKIAVRQGMITLRQNGWKAVLDGITTPGEVMNVTVKDSDVDIENFADVKHFSCKGDQAESAKKISRSDKIKQRKNWETNNLYDARVFPRVFEHIDIRYCLLKLDANDPNFLVPDGVEYTTVSHDISAGGLRFISKEKLTVGSILELKIYLKEEHKTIACLAKVYRVEEDSMQNIYTMVNYYLDLTSADRVSLKKYVEKAMKSGATEPLSD